MDVKCRKCGASVPEDHAFCADCGAVMAEGGTTRTARADEMPELAATISGQYSSEQVETAVARRREQKREQERADTNAAQPPPRAAGRAAVQPATAADGGGGSKSRVYIALGIVAVLLLCALLFYLLGVIVSGRNP